MTEPPVAPRAARTAVRAAASTAASEHRRLRELLAQVEDAFERPSPRAGIGPDVVAARLDALRGPLRAHFEEEERGRLFEEIEERSPEQAPLCARLRAEHASILRRLDALRTASPEGRRGPAWGHDVRSFLADLAGHEESETELLTRTLAPERA